MSTDYILEYKKEQSEFFINRIITQLNNQSKVVSAGYIMKSMRELCSYSACKSPLKKLEAYRKLLSIYRQNEK